MKGIFYFLLIISPLCADAQYYFFQLHINFETNGQFAVIDPSQPCNIWQKGTPFKTFFDSAYSVPNAIVTDTLNYYPPDNLSSFEVKIIAPGACWGVGNVSFEHKYKTDPYQAGGYVEVAYDTSTVFKNIIYDTIEPEIGYGKTGFYGLNDTIFGGIPAFSGNSGGWISSDYMWIWQMGVKNPFHDSLTIRFTFTSSPSAVPDEGWMIDDIDLWLDWCTGGIGEASRVIPEVRISPNPFSDQAKAQIVDGSPGNYLFTVFDSRGVKVLEKTVSAPSFDLKKEKLSSGIYFYQLTGRSGQAGSGKFIIR